ncbi:MAG: Uroporphyrinogen deCOase protein [Thermoproteota archaeon]|nr:Uroporphyrinogen deCOase protein [Thermoproteota archaeon]
MNGKERILKTFNFEEPDRVPMWELRIDGPHVETLTGIRWIGSSKETNLDRRGIERHNVEAKVHCYKRLEFSMIMEAPTAADGWRPQTLPDGSFIDEWGRVRVYDALAKMSFPTRGSINTPEEFEAFSFPDPQGPRVLHAFEYLVKLVNGEMAVAAEVRAPFATAWEMFGVQNFCQWLYDKPQFIRKAIERITDYNIELIKIMVDAGADVILSNGDIAEKNGPMVSPKYFDEIFFSNMKKEVNTANRKGVKFIKHTDGNINPLLDGLSKTVDGLHSLDPSAGVVLGEVKEKYGDHLILMGNVSVDRLATAAREEIVAETRECIKQAATGGGYVLSSSNSWYANAKLDNCLAMNETGRRHGKYPIEL